MARFKQGESGNPAGRPKGRVSITTAIRQKLEETNPKTKRQYVYDLVDVMVEKAVKEKDFRFIKEIWNHVDGSPRQTTELQGDGNLITGVDIFVRDERKVEQANLAVKRFLNISEEATERYGLSGVKKGDE